MAAVRRSARPFSPVPEPSADLPPTALKVVVFDADLQDICRSPFPPESGTPRLRRGPSPPLPHFSSSTPPRKGYAATAAPPLAAIAALLFAAPSPAASAPCAATSVAAGRAPAAAVGRAVRCLVNAPRAAHGLTP